MTMVSIDPGRSSGLAWWSPTGELRLVRGGRGRGGAPSVLGCRSELVTGAELLGGGVDVLVVEGQWFAQGVSGGFNRVVALVEARCAWVHAAQLTWPGAVVEVVSPMVWMRELVGAPAGRAQRVEELVRERYQEDQVRWTEDMCAAVGLGVWWWRRRGEEESS